MLVKEDYKKIIEAVTTDPLIFASFAWDRLLDSNGTACSPPPRINENLLSILKEFFDEEPEIYEIAYESLKGYMQKKWLWQSYTLKAYATLLEGFYSYDDCLEMIWNSLKYRQKKIDSSLATIEKLAVIERERG